MTPRAQTWLHLLPGDCDFECRAAAPWVRDALVDRGTPGGRRVVVEYGSSATPGSLDGAHAFVGINCASMTEASLRGAGFSHIQRLAVLPGLHNARWFVPLGRPAVSSAAFDLYTPARTSAKL